MTVITTPSGVRDLAKDRAEDPDAVQRYLVQKFGSDLPEVEAAMHALAEAYPRKRLASMGFRLYERFRREIPEGVRGWGAKGGLDLEHIRAMAAEA